MLSVDHKVRKGVFGFLFRICCLDEQGVEDGILEWGCWKENLLVESIYLYCIIQCTLQIITILI